MPKGTKWVALAKIQKVSYMNQLLVQIHPVSVILSCEASFNSFFRFIYSVRQEVNGP